MIRVYDATTKSITDTEGVTHDFYNGSAEFPEEGWILLRFKEGTLTLQEAYTHLLRVRLQDRNTKYFMTEVVGDVTASVGADTYEELYDLIQLIQIQEETNNDN